jgi:mRNA-degrading endonuclease RelE of RelBE toxin-antitoxin system
MSYNIIATPKFRQELKHLVKKYPSLKKEYSSLIISLEEKSNIGIALGNNCFKSGWQLNQKVKENQVEQELLLTCR